MPTIPCPLCRSKDFQTILTSKDLLHRTDETSFTLARCRHCGLKIVNPQPTWDTLKKYYPSHYVSYKPGKTPQPEKLLMHQRLVRFLSKIRQRILPGKIPSFLRAPKGRFLDVGCGNGHLLESMHRMRPQWTFEGIEPVGTAARLARKRGFRVKATSLEGAKFASNSFEVVYLSHVLEHVPQPLETLLEVHRILRPGGTVVLILPNTRSVGAWIFGRYWYPLDLPRHLSHFAPRTLKRLARTAHFHVHTLRFDKNPKHLLKSLRLRRGRADLNLQADHFNPLIWWLLKPFTHGLGLLGLGDVMYVELKKPL